MRALCLFIFLMLTAALLTAQPPCSSQVRQRDADDVASVRAMLRKVPVSADEPDNEVPTAAQDEISRLKSALAATARDVVECAVDPKPQTMEAELAKLLAANPPQPPAGSVSNNDPRYQEFLASEFGRNLLVSVSTLSRNLLAVQFTFHVPCGDDNVLMLFAWEGASWRERMVWQSKPYGQIDGAFGDFYLFNLLNGGRAAPWRLVVAHGHPWCMSRFSGFDIDVLEPTAVPDKPKIVWHTEREYSRFEFDPRLTAEGDTFELRLHADEMVFNEDGFELTVIYRYHVEGSSVTRLEPIATTGRGFVEEWLSMPWEEAAAQSAAGGLSSLKAVHQSYEKSYPANRNTYTSWEAEPVRTCGADQYQVQFDTNRNTIVPGKPGGDIRKEGSYFFQILRVANGYEMQSVATSPNKVCDGPDLMSAH